MALGISPKSEQSFENSDLTPEEFIVIALEVSKELEWNTGYISDKGFVAYTKFTWRSYGEEIKISMNENRVTVRSECTGSQIMDWGKNKRNVEMFITHFKNLSNKYSKEELAQKFSEVKQNFVSNEQDILTQTPLNTKGNIKSFFSIFIPTEEFFVTPLLIDLNIIYFLFMVASGANVFLPNSNDLLYWGANFKSATLQGEWWRLFTCCFVHIGIFHLLFNMYALLYIGVLLEPILGKTKFFSAYVVTGIAASLTSLLWNDLIISAGASGAIFGMYGVFLAMLTTNHIEKAARRTLLTSILVFVGYNLLNGMKGGIDNAAHIGGLLSGLLVGYVFYPSLKETESRKYENIGLSFIFVSIITATILILNTATDEIGIYDEKMKDFVRMEAKALEIYNLPAGTTDQKILDMIKEDGVKNWENCIVMFTDLQKLNLPDALQDRLVLMKKYCKLRKESYLLLDKAISESSEQYATQIDSLNVKIQEVIKTLSNE